MQGRGNEMEVTKNGEEAAKDGTKKGGKRRRGACDMYLGQVLQFFIAGGGNVTYTQIQTSHIKT